MFEIVGWKLVIDVEDVVCTNVKDSEVQLAGYIYPQLLHSFSMYFIPLLLVTYQ